MRFMVAVYPGNQKRYEAGIMPEPELLGRMMRYNEELADAGVMLSGEGMHPPSKGCWIRFSGSGPEEEAEGPAPFSGKGMGGFWIFEVSSKEEALKWAKKAPMEEGDVLEVRQLFESSDFDGDIERRESELRKRLGK